MKRKKLKLSAVAAATAVGLLFSGAAAASAAAYTVYPAEGGTWKHGTYVFSGTQWDAYSEYYHGSKQHAAVAWWVPGASKTWSGKAAAGKWAKDSILGDTAGKAGYAVY